MATRIVFILLLSVLSGFAPPAQADVTVTLKNFLGQPMGRALHVKLRSVHEAWKDSKKDALLVQEVIALAEQFGKQRTDGAPQVRLGKQELELICFEFVSG